MRRWQKRLLPLVSLALVGGVLALSACASGMTGSWVPSKGSVVWTVKPSETGYDMGVKAARPGGLVISKDGDNYKVTLVSGDGSRYPVTAKMDGARLGVSMNSYGGPSFFLHQTGTSTLSMEELQGQALVHVADFKSGTP